MPYSIDIINSEGEKETFSSKKIYRSAKRAGADAKTAKKIAEIIKREVFSGMKTVDIFKRVRELLEEKNFQLALKFSLKEAMKKLGPDGFNFEKYIGRVLESGGFKVEINQYLPGACVEGYEIDFIAAKDKLIYVGECKYRNSAGERIDTKELLANHARFSDILAGPYFKREKKKEIKTIMVTNTKFTSRAKRYARCKGIELLGWRHPYNEGLEHLIEKEKLYPITILPSLKKHLKDLFVSQQIMLAQDILEIDLPIFAQQNHISIKDLKPLAKEASILLEV